MENHDLIAIPKNASLDVADGTLFVNRKPFIVINPSTDRIQSVGTDNEGKKVVRYHSDEGGISEVLASEIQGEWA